MQILESFRNVFKIEELRRRILITLGLLAVFRFGSHVVMPGVNPEAVAFLKSELSGAYGGFFHFMQMFSGGGFGNFALFALGIMPYITSSIIMQLMTKVHPGLEALVKEGSAGQRKISQYTRYLTVPICIFQSIVAVRWLLSFQEQRGKQILLSAGFGAQLEMVIAMMAGALFIMWLGEQITEHGVGNGASLLIMGGIVARLPAVGYEMVQKARSGEITTDAVVIVTALYLLVVAAIVLITQAQRRIPIQHAKHFKGRRVYMGSRNYLPLRVNTAGVMPVIFASSILIVPALMSQIGPLSWMNDVFDRREFFYSAFYIIAIFFFSYFWTYLFFQPNEISNNLKEYGSFIPGIRPGENTANYIDTILSRVTLCGAAFLCVIALLPDLMSVWLNVDRFLVAFLGGTGILIVVGVGLDVIQKIESYLLMHHYEGFVGPGGIRGRR